MRLLVEVAFLLPDEGAEYVTSVLNVVFNYCTQIMVEVPQAEPVKAEIDGARPTIGMYPHSSG